MHRKAGGGVAGFSVQGHKPRLADGAGFHQLPP